MPSSPSTPNRRRRSSDIGISLSFTSASPHSDGRSSKRPSNSRRSSQCSVTTPSTPPLTFTHDRSGYLESSNGFNDLLDPDNTKGFGNLADELAEALDEEDENGHELEDEGPEPLRDRAEAIHHDRLKENKHQIFRNGSQQGPAISRSSTQQATSDLPLRLSPPKEALRSRHTRKMSQYDGSDYGDGSGLEGTHGLSPSLEARLATVENLARRGTEANGSDADEIVQRVANSLKNLGPQAGVENGTTR